MIWTKNSAKLNRKDPAEELACFLLLMRSVYFDKSTDVFGASGLSLAKPFVAV